ncbi:MAG TPA: STAS domain-containing protein [Mycobacteriales bacterium]
MTALTLTSQVGPDGTVVLLTGELDLATAGDLPRFVAALAPEDCRSVHLDLAGLDFIDAAGLTALVRAHAVVAQRSGRMTVGRPQPLGRLLFELTALPVTIVDRAVRATPRSA